jgi:hypothetical protein
MTAGDPPTMTTTEKTRPTANFHPASPILRVSNLKASLDHYVRILGFAIDWEYGDIIASVSRDRCNLMLCQGDQGNPGSWVWIGVADSTTLHAEYVRTGATIRMPPTNYAWALEMQIEDLDGNVLRFGSDRLEKVPYGPWKDMYGKIWN